MGPGREQLGVLRTLLGTRLSLDFSPSCCLWEAGSPQSGYSAQRVWVRAGGSRDRRLPAVNRARSRPASCPPEPPGPRLRHPQSPGRVPGVCDERPCPEPALVLSAVGPLSSLVSLSCSTEPPASHVRGWSLSASCASGWKRPGWAFRSAGGWGADLLGPPRQGVRPVLRALGAWLSPVVRGPRTRCWRVEHCPPLLGAAVQTRPGRPRCVLLVFACELGASQLLSKTIFCSSNSLIVIRLCRPLGEGLGEAQLWLLLALGEGPPSGAVTRGPSFCGYCPPPPQGRPRPPPTMEDSAGLQAEAQSELPWRGVGCGDAGSDQERGGCCVRPVWRGVAGPGVGALEATGRAGPPSRLGETGRGLPRDQEDFAQRWRFSQKWGGKSRGCVSAAGPLEAALPGGPCHEHPV